MTATPDSMGLLMAVSAMKDAIPQDKPLKERLEFAMDYAIKRQRDLFWMSYTVDDDLIFRTAIAAVMIDSNELDKDIITRSLKPMKILSAAMSGVPVDFARMELGDDLLPLWGMFNTAKNANNR